MNPKKPMNLCDQVREIVPGLDEPFMLGDVLDARPELEPNWRDVNATLHRLCNRGELEKTKIPNPKGHGEVSQYTRTKLLREPGTPPSNRRLGGVPRDIGNPDAALRLQHALNQMAWARRSRPQGSCPSSTRHEAATLTP